MMRHYLFEKLYALLNRKEQSHFDRWLPAELGDKNKELLRLFVAWKSGTSWEELLGAFTPGRLEHLRNELVENLETFMAYLSFRKDMLNRDRLALQEISQRNTDQRNVQKLFAGTYHKLQKRLQSQPIRDIHYHQCQFEYYSLLQAYHIAFPSSLGKKKSFLPERVEAATEASKFQLRHLALTTMVMNVDMPTELSAIQNWLFSTEQKKSPPNLETIYYCFFEAYDNEVWKQSVSPAYFEPLIEQFRSLYQQVSEAYQKDLYLFLYNLLSRCTKNAHVTQQILFFRQLLALSKWAYDAGIQPMHRQQYKNVLALYMNIIQRTENKKEQDSIFAEAASYLEKACQSLPYEEQKSAQRYTEVFFHFSRKEYDKISWGVKMDDLSDAFFTIGHKVISLQAQYELNKDLDIAPIIHSLSQRVRKSSVLPPLDKKAYLNRLSFFQKITKAKSPVKLKKLSEEISQTQPLSGQIWLMKTLKERLGELEKKAN